ncbi:MAG TPA: hypothetical protein VHW67_05585 [Solirubrobacteraceae bacterium]|nr:hypothetical protein [Solirubrobacteraceae bacterium]
MSAVRNALDTLRYDWLGASIGGPETSMRGQWLTLIVSALLVFGCFFAIGRMRSGSSSQVGGSALTAFSEHAAIPGALHGGSPAAGAVPVAIATPPPPPPSPITSNAESVRAAEAARSFAAEASRTVAPGATAPEESAPAPEPKPTVAKTPARSGGSGGGHRSGGGSGSAGGGGSFDSSE